MFIDVSTPMRGGHYVWRVKRPGEDGVAGALLWLACQQLYQGRFRWAKENGSLSLSQAQFDAQRDGRSRPRRDDRETRVALGQTVFGQG